MTQAEDNKYPYLTFIEHVDPSTPAAGTARLFVDSADGLLKMIDDADVVTELSPGSGLAAHLADTTDAHDASAVSIADAGGYYTGTTVEAALQEAYAAASAGADPIAQMFGAPDTAFEFASSSLTGLTAIGSPASEAAHTTIPGALYYRDATSTTAWMGRYLASPATPFTAITKIYAGNPAANYNAAALMVGVADPTTGALVTTSFTYNSTRKVNVEKFTNRTTFVTTVTATGYEWPPTPLYLAIVVNSTTSLDFYASMDGRAWRKHTSAYNPSITVGSVGLVMKSESSAGFACAFDFLRIWNSAKTFLS